MHPPSADPTAAHEPAVDTGTQRALAAERPSEHVQWCLYGQLEEHDRVRRIPINSFPFRIGRRESVGLPLLANCISKDHAELELRSGEPWVRDLGSTNGSFLNGQRLTEPAAVRDGDLLQFATLVFRIALEKPSDDVHTLHENACDRALVMMQFDRLINDGAVAPFFQPIVYMETKSVLGYEVLGRSRLFGLRTPAEMFAAASQLNVEVELSELLRLKGVQLARQFPDGTEIYVNTHPLELNRRRLVESLTVVREACPNQRIILEVHEAAITDPAEVVELKAALDGLNIRLAFDDFGAGRSRLVELSEVRPDVVKFDMKLTRDIHRAPARRQEAVSLIAKVVNDLGIISLAEGVEHPESHEVLREMNFKLGQGFYYGRPQPIHHYLKDPHHALTPPTS